ncbi:CLAVATA3/ESR (CLE)-related protein 45 [Durio zibethinus]|uniref:CLAVATA3/ESR (CLE)-related protein 45 n=1 Tax=Durio zibethinus TaxID=66656 RepID=A0A6P5Y4N2_DURZI|nr:CLAVATA3/ESR (CLE)-related protein 45 [Durio zibethinus]
MVCSAQRVLIFLIIFELLAVQADKVSGLRRIDLVFTYSQEEDGIASRRNRRILEAADMKGMGTGKNLPAPVNNTFDPNQSSKRRVRRGSDPIHNRS